ncbi:NADH:ubiquinone oxidoreductase 6.6kD subunit [Hypoxylon sp. FL1284]|nr:NADH:ubiquinone oxidoreductase 6.6kD subunit [Hypoxylon sp. FL1284]
MAGLEHYPMAMDPAILKLGNMTTNRHKYFRWTARTGRITFMYAVFVPVLFGILAYKTDGKYNFRAKRKGDAIKEF